MSLHFKTIAFCAVAILNIICSNAFAFKDKSKDRDTTKAMPHVKPKTYSEIIKGAKKFPGIFELYQDTATGVVHMLISEEQLNKEYILFSHVMNGVVDAHFFKGSYLKSNIFTITKYFDRIEFTEENTSLYFDPANPLSKAKESNISKSIMLNEKIEASENKKYLIKCDALFLKETLSQIKPANNPNPNAAREFKLGNLDKDKTKILKVKNYPENTDVQVEYVYSQEAPVEGGSLGVTDARNVSIQIQHSLIAVPQNDFEPRFDDPRVGFFTEQVNDMTTKNPIAYRDLIHRWHLKKKDSNAEMSEPVQPIIWWIENTTPYEFRDAIKEALLNWNIAFEKAGFKNAVVVKEQPDNADWDAGDIRYNVLRWTSSPNPPFGGYGPSFVNPRTGQILGADIMLEFVYHTNRLKIEKIINLADYGNEENIDFKNQRFCSFGEKMQESVLLGTTLLLADGNNEQTLKGLQREAIVELVMHETGHCLGLNHNMKASQLYSPDQINDKEFIKGKPLVGSVMDYVVINAPRDRSKQTQYFTSVLGPYDIWAIECGYKPFKTEDERQSVLAKSTQPELMFGNDADDMRSAGNGIDPRVNIDDLSNDQIKFSIDRMELVNDLMKKLKTQYNTPGKSYQEMRQAFYTLNGQYNMAANVISRFVGGVYVDRAMIGQPGATKPYTPVSLADQKRAMAAISKYVFAPDAFAVPADIYNYLALQRRGYNFGGSTEDPKIHDRVLTEQKEVLKQLLHKNTLQRLVDSKLYGNQYSLSDFMVELTNSVFSADLNTNVNSFRQNLQIEYVKSLINIVNSPDYMSTSKSMAVYLLKDIKKKQSSIVGDVSTLAHRENIRTLITNSIEKYK